MFLVDVTERGGEPQRYVFYKPELTIGRIEGNDIVLPKGNVSKRHARIVYRDGKYIAVDLKSTNGTWVGGRKLTSPLVIKDDEPVYVGDFAIRVMSPEDAFDVDEDTQPIDATELRLLASVAAREDGSRMVYADWLDEHGDPTRAEFLRLQESLAGRAANDPAFQQATERLRVLAPYIDMSWRFKVATPLIENCLRVELRCPKEWSSLTPTDQPNVRHCEACKQRVVYCISVDQAARHARSGQCVVVDVGATRSAGDLDPSPPMVMGRMVVPRR